MTERERQRVRSRAKHRCEYFRLPDAVVWVEFEIDHIIARKHRLDSQLANLAYSCALCNACKGPNLSGLDPLSDSIRPVRLFHPRRDHWHDHFETHGPAILGRTAVGRATMSVLKMNEDEILEARAALLAEGLWPAEEIA